MTWISRHSWDEAAERVTKNHLQDHAQCSIWSFWRSLLYEALANCKCQCFCFLRSWPTGIAKTPPPLPWHWEIMILSVLSSTFVVLLFFLQFEANNINSLCNAHVCCLSFFQNPAWRIYSPCFVVMEFLHLHICTWTWWISCWLMGVPHLNGWPPLRCPSFTMPTKSWQSFGSPKGAQLKGIDY